MKALPSAKVSTGLLLIMKTRGSGMKKREYGRDYSQIYQKSEEKKRREQKALRTKKK
jgi:hypothetical protein